MAEETQEPKSEARDLPAIYLTDDDAKKFNRRLSHVIAEAGGVRLVNVSGPRAPVVQAETGIKNQAIKAMKAFAQGRRVHTGEIPLETVETLLAVMKRAVEVLGSPDKAERWLHTPVPSLGEMPIALLRTVEGAAKVEDALLAIEDGSW